MSDPKPSKETLEEKRVRRLADMKRLFADSDKDSVADMLRKSKAAKRPNES